MDASYVAGLVDGEGSLYISLSGERGTYQPELAIANTSRELLDKVADWFGCGKVYKTGRTNSIESGRMQCYNFRIRG